MPRLILALALLSACGLSHAHEHAQSSQRHYLFTHGDPMQLIAAATLNKQSFIPVDPTAAFKDYTLSSTEYIYQTSDIDVDPNTVADIEAGEEPPTDLRTNTLHSFAFTAAGDDFHYGPSTGDDSALVFSKSGDKLALTNAYGEAVEMLHYSMKDDKEAFSLLYKVTNSRGGAALGALYFNKLHENAVALADVSKDFHFLLGDGVVNPWADPILHLELCGKISPPEEERLRRAINAWVKKGRIGQRTLTITRTEQAPAFSDLNSHCLSIVDDYLFENNNNFAMEGETVPLLDLRRQQLQAAHIFISRHGLNKFEPDAFYTPQFERTVTHEVGHFLGLDHEFVTNPDGQLKFKSIMSYDSKSTVVTEHDFAAIELLYGAYPP